MENNHFFFDGSALLGDIRRLRASDSRFVGKRLDLVRLVSSFAGSDLQHLHAGSYRRAVFYFVQKDERLDASVVLPDPSQAGTAADIRVEFCGKRIQQFAQANEWLTARGAPEFVTECVYRSEKAVDTQLCCDALQLAALGKLERLFLYTNDYDFVPLFQALRRLGINVNLILLLGEKVNRDLAAESDGFFVLADYLLKFSFGVKDEPPPGASADTATETQDASPTEK